MKEALKKIVDTFHESKPKIDAFLKIDANAQRQEYKMAS